jgi:hypothetical protein
MCPSVAAKGAVVQCLPDVVDDDLLAVVTSWPKLPAAVRAGIVAMLKVSGRGQKVPTCLAIRGMRGKESREKRGVLPRKMQSITWEGVRGLASTGAEAKFVFSLLMALEAPFDLGARANRLAKPPLRQR